MKTYKFLELIELKKAGRKFKFSRGICSIHSDRLTENSNWSVGQILDDWTVEFEPEVVEFECTFHLIRNVYGYKLQCSSISINASELSKKLSAGKFKVVATEIVEGE